MEVEFTLTTADLLALERRLLEPEESFRRERDLADGSRLRRVDWHWGQLLLLAAPVVAGAVVGGAAWLVSWATAVALATLGVVYCVTQHSRYVLQSRLHTHPWNLWARGPMRLSLTPEGVAKVGESSHSFVSWRVIVWITATADHIFLYDSTDTAYVVPRRAFRDGMHFREFLDLARGYLDGTAPLPDAAAGSAAHDTTAIQCETRVTENPHASGRRLPHPRRI